MNRVILNQNRCSFESERLFIFVRMRNDRGVTVSDSSLTVKEGTSETYTVVLDSRPTGDVRVTPSRTSGDADVTVSGALTFTPDNWSSAQTVTVSAAEDLDSNDDTAVIGHAVSGGDYGSEMVGSVTVTVTDDEFASRGVLLSADIKEVLESAGATTITVTAALNGGSRASTTPVEVSVGAGTSTATAGTDFATVNNFTVTIAAGTLSQTATFTLDPTDDDVDENYFESVAVSGTTTVPAFTVTGTAVNILDDDDAPTVTLVLTPGSIEESDDSDTSNVQENRAVVTATLNRASSVATTVTVSALPNAPAVAGDYSLSANKELTIPAGSKSSTGTVTITAVDNVLDTADKTVAVKGSATNTLGIIAPADRSLTIVDDDDRGVTVSDSSLTVKEGSSETYTVVLDSRPTGDVRVTPSRTSGDADVTVSGALTFTPDNWSSAQTVTVSAAEDLDSNDDTAVIGHAVSGGDYGSEMVGSVTVTVTDDELASRGVLLSADIKEVLESAGATTITVTAALNGGSRLSDTPVVVSVGAGTSTATAGTDFATVNNFTVTIAAGTLSQTATFTLDPTDDDVDENYFESVAVSGTTTVPAFSVIGTAVNILDDDDRGVTVSDSSLTVKEGSSETYTVVLDSRPTGDVRVTPSRTSGDADVTVSGALTFTPDNWSSAQTVTVSAAEDLDSNDDTAVIGHAVSGGDYGSETAPSVTVTVTDDELASRGILLSADIKEVLESAGAATITVTAALNGGSRLSDTPVEVSVGAGTSTATAGTDFATVEDFTVTIAAGTLSQTATFTLDPTDDDVDENYFESVDVSGTTTVPAFTVIGTAVYILDDDGRGVTVSDSSLTVNEGSSETYTVVLDSRPTGDVRVTPSRTSGDADVTVSGALTFTPDNWSSAQTVTVSAAEDLDSNDDTAVIGHAVSGGDYGAEMVGSVTVTVTDDEFASRGVLLSADIKEVLESAGATTITVTAALNGGSRLSDTPVVVSVGAGTSTATAGTDFATVNNFTVTIAAGTLSQTATFTLDPTDDDVDENYFESVAVSGTTTVPAFSVIGTAVNILDDDDRGVTVSDSSLTVKEGSSETYTVVLDSRPTGDVRVTPSRTSGDADVTVSGALTFTPDNWSSAQTVTVSAAEDLDSNDDTAVIGHAVSGGDYGSETAPSVTVTVTDDELASRGILLSADIKEVLESAGAATITVTAALNGGSRLSDTPVEVSVGAGTSTATAGTDFATVEDFTVTIAAGTLSQTATFTLDPTDDDVDENYFESVDVSGTTTVPAFTVIGTAVYILDDDGRGVTVSDSSLTVNEGSSETYTVVLDSRPTGDVRVTPSRTSGDADVTVSGALTFTPDNWSSAQTVTVSAAEDLDSNDDTAVIGHAVSGGDYGAEMVGSVTVTVTDDELASRGVLLSADIKEVLESAGAATITVTAALNGGTRAASTTPVEVSVGAGTSTATSGTDFATVEDFTVTIAAGTLSQTATFTLDPTDDDVDENYFESVDVSGTTTVPAFTVIGTAVYILDDDDRGVTVSDSSLTVNEGSSETYTVVLDSRPTGDVRVTPSRTSGDADVTVSGALTFTPDNWSSAQTVTVSAAEDLDSNDDTAVIGHAVSGGDYGSETAGSVTVTVTTTSWPRGEYCCRRTSKKSWSSPAPPRSR